MSENNDQVEEQPRLLRVFLSYADEDTEAVQDLYRRLHQDGLDPWMSAEDLQVGQEREDAIGKAMQTSDVVTLRTRSSAAASCVRSPRKSAQQATCPVPRGLRMLRAAPKRQTVYDT